MYQPNESRTYFYTFNLPNIPQNWTASYHAQYSNKFYAESQGSIYDDESIKERTQCDPLTTTLLLDEFPSNLLLEELPSTNIGNGNNSGSTNNPPTDTGNPPPIFGGFDLGDEDTESPIFGGFGLGDGP